jgi:hypothetical protein
LIEIVLDRNDVPEFLSDTIKSLARGHDRPSESRAA